MALACDRGISVYDASYVALALTLDIRMVTADRRLGKRLGADFVDRLDVL